MLVYGKYECFVMQMLYVCVLCALCVSDIQDCWFVLAARNHSLAVLLPKRETSCN